MMLDFQFLPGGDLSLIGFLGAGVARESPWYQVCILGVKGWMDGWTDGEWGFRAGAEEQGIHVDGSGPL